MNAHFKSDQIVLMNKNIFLILFFVLPFTLSGTDDSLYVKSIESITDKFLELISCEIGEETDWDAFKYLFAPSAQIYFTNQNAPKGQKISAMNVDDFVKILGPMYKRDGFEEYALGLTVNEFNGIANVFQSYCCKNLSGTYEKRGINSYQLIFADERWWIVNTTFIDATEENTIPKKYLSKK